MNKEHKKLIDDVIKLETELANPKMPFLVKLSLLVCLIPVVLSFAVGLWPLGLGFGLVWLMIYFFSR